ncbi:MAG: hypothetical protein GYA17_15540 [Chloroflexi bacterium]|nr:CopD family protein [Anaerolineaceae bacterium]NMB89772.1 hypothetical protein [Chloroflexota bacterium]
MASDAPGWALTIAYWLHMLATVVWIGELAAFSLLVVPIVRSSLPPELQARFLQKVQARIQQVGWFCLGVLVVTGMFQMSAHPSYEGFLAISNPWSLAILLKHAAVGIMILFSAYLTWGINPLLQRLLLVQSRGGETPPGQLARLQQREILFWRLNFAVSILVLALTAWARAA